LNPDSFQDKELLKIKDIPDISVRNYQRDDNLDQKEDSKEALMFAAAEAAWDKQDILNAIQEGDKDDKDRDLLTFVTDLLHAPSEYTKRLPAQDRYFLS
jgi:hypothetical protein